MDDFFQIRRGETAKIRVSDKLNNRDKRIVRAVIWRREKVAGQDIGECGIFEIY